MRFDIYHHVTHYFDPEALELLSGQLDSLKTQGDAIMASQEEAAAQLAAVNEKLVKIGTETAGLLTSIEELKAALAAAGNVTPALQEKIDEVAARAGAVDDLVPDAV